jgi:hypothetical protein
MSEAKHNGHVLDSLTPYCDGALDLSATANVKAHVEICEECAAELRDVQSFAATWQELGISALVESLPQPGDGHVEEADLWYLADPATRPIPDDFKEKMRHVLGCRQCYTALRDCRAAILESSGDPDVAERADVAWDRLRANQLRLLVAYVVKRHVEEAASRGGSAGLGRLRIGLGGPRPMRMLSESGLSGPETVEREIGDSWEFERAFGDYSFSVVITPRDFERQTLEISLNVIRLPGHSSALDLRAEISTPDAPSKFFPFVDHKVVFGVMPLRDSQITIADHTTGSTIGFIQITRQPS